MKKALNVFLVIVLFLLFKSSNVYADLVFPAIANQFVVSFVVGFYWSLAMALLILLVEAFFIKGLLKVNYLVALVTAFVINLISSVAGAIITTVTFGQGTNVFAYGDMRFGTYLGLIPGYILTLLLEGALLLFLVLLLKRGKKAMECFKTSGIMNFFSYLILLLGIVIADLLTKGNNFNIR